jgi:hypothetical protein
MDREGKIRLIGGILLGGMGLSLLYHVVLGTVFHLRGYPYDTFLFRAEDRFNDFYNIYHAAATGHPYRFDVSVYFPFTFLVMGALTLLPAAAALCGVIGLFTAALLVQIRRALAPLQGREAGMWTFVIGMLTYPYLFAVDRGNVELLVFLLILLFLRAYAKENYLQGGLWLAMAAAMKVYPGVFFLLLLKKRKWAALGAGLALIVVLNLAGAVLATGGLEETLRGLPRCLRAFDQTYIGQPHGLQHGAGLFGVLELGLLPLIPRSDPGAASRWIHALRAGYPVLALVLFGFAAWFILRRESPLWKDVLVLVACMILLPQVSFDYKLIHLYFPLLLFLRSPSRVPRDAVGAVLFGLLLIPKDYGLLFADVSTAVVLNPLLLALLVGWAVTWRQAEPVPAGASPDILPQEGA